MVLTNRTCAAENTLTVDNESSFLDGRFDAHEIGWIIAGATAIISTVITLITVWRHCRNYFVPREQRQILRILLMPPVYAIISFFSYRFFREYTYYSLALVVYESLVLAAFLMLLLQYIGESTEAQRSVLMQKEKRKIPIPFCCIRFRPSKPYFLHALKWSVLQYSLLRPLISLAGVITEAFNVYCSTGYSIYFASVYLDSVDFVSISVALYGLIVFYALVKDRLAGNQPLAKFLSIKGIVMITFYQSFVFSVLQNYNVIKATKYWTATNVADGLQALCTCCEMVIFSAVFMWAFSAKRYKEKRPPGAKLTNPFWSFLDSLNYSDFLRDGWNGLVFAVRFILGRPDTRSTQMKNSGGFNIEGAFNKHETGDEKYRAGANGDGTYHQSPPSSESDYENGNNGPAMNGKMGGMKNTNSTSTPLSSLPPTAFGKGRDGGVRAGSGRGLAATAAAASAENGLGNSVPSDNPSAMRQLDQQYQSGGQSYMHPSLQQPNRQADTYSQPSRPYDNLAQNHDNYADPSNGFQQRQGQQAPTQIPNNADYQPQQNYQGYDSRYGRAR